MHPPKLLAISDVHLPGPANARDALIEFYVGDLGFERVEATAGIVLRGWPRSGPRLVLDLSEEVPPRPMRRQALIEVRSLTAIAEVLTERRVPCEWSSGWFFFDRRLELLDPGGNWVELVTSHSC